MFNFANAVRSFRALAIIAASAVTLTACAGGSGGTSANLNTDTGSPGRVVQQADTSDVPQVVLPDGSVVYVPENTGVPVIPGTVNTATLNNANQPQTTTTQNGVTTTTIELPPVQTFEPLPATGNAPELVQFSETDTPMDASLTNTQGETCVVESC